MSQPSLLPDHKRGVIAMSGGDARAVLQGVITNDIDRLAPGAPLYAALLTPQGKYLFDFFLIVPGDGRVLIAPNHPTGIADGFAMFDALKHIRPDQIYFANRDAIRVAPHLEEVLIPVEWVAEKRTRERSRETLISTKGAFSDERCIVLFPSGRLAFMDDEKVLTEQEWMPSIAIFARKYDCPVIPVHIKARNSWLYYWFWRVNTELRDITLFNELLNKKGQRFEITFGAPIPASALNGEPADVAAKLRDHTVQDVVVGTPWEPFLKNVGIKSDN